MSRASFRASSALVAFLRLTFSVERRELRWRVFVTCSEIPSYDLVVPALLDKGVNGLQDACQLTPGAYKDCFRQLLLGCALTSR